MCNNITISLCSEVKCCILDGEMVGWDPENEVFL